MVRDGLKSVVSAFVPVFLPNVVREFLRGVSRSVSTGMTSSTGGIEAVPEVVPRCWGKGTSVEATRMAAAVMRMVVVGVVPRAMVVSETIAARGTRLRHIVHKVVLGVGAGERCGRDEWLRRDSLEEKHGYDDWKMTVAKGGDGEERKGETRLYRLPRLPQRVWISMIGDALPDARRL